MTHWNILTACTVTLCVTACASAQTARLSYQIGKIGVTEDSKAVVLRTKPPARLELIGATRPWPPLLLDEAGHVYAGASVYKTATGQKAHAAPVKPGQTSLQYPAGLSVTVTDAGYVFKQRASACTLSPASFGLDTGKKAIEFLQDLNLTIVPGDDKILALVAPPTDEETQYHISNVDLGSCKVSVLARLKNPDNLVQFGWSPKGGWWLTGSTEQTVLRSRDGSHWEPVKLPADISALVSSYVVSDSEMWLAAGLPSGPPVDPYMLVYTSNGGKTWASPRLNDPLLRKLPAAWLEGYRRVAMATGKKSSNR